MQATSHKMMSMEMEMKRGKSVQHAAESSYQMPS